MFTYTPICVKLFNHRRDSICLEDLRHFFFFAKSHLLSKQLLFKLYGKLSCPVFKYPLDVAKGLWEKQSSGLSKASELLKEIAMGNRKDKSLNIEPGSISSKDRKKVKLRAEYLKTVLA